MPPKLPSLHGVVSSGGSLTQEVNKALASIRAQRATGVEPQGGAALTAFFAEAAKASKPYVPPKPEGATRWSFETMHTDWWLANQNGDPVDRSSIVDEFNSDNGKALRIGTAANSDERKKRKSALRYGVGKYTWRVYVSDLDGQCSIGCWLYNDDLHELDFEIAHGKAADRLKYGARPDQVLAFMTNQDGPYYQSVVPITRNAWHMCTIELGLKKNAAAAFVYTVDWYIDDVRVGQIAELEFGQNKPFAMYCSLENLTFTGDASPIKDNYGLWDFVEYTPLPNSVAPSPTPP